MRHPARLRSAGQTLGELGCPLGPGDAGTTSSAQRPCIAPPPCCLLLSLKTLFPTLAKLRSFVYALQKIMIMKHFKGCEKMNCRCPSPHHADSTTVKMCPPWLLASPQLHAQVFESYPQASYDFASVTHCESFKYGHFPQTHGLPRQRIHPQCRRCRRHRFRPWVRKIPWRRAWDSLQYSRLENPTDRGAWWAAVHRVTDSNTTEVTEHARVEP